MSNINEKAPRGTANSEQGANEINQVQDSIHQIECQQL